LGGGAIVRRRRPLHSGKKERERRVCWKCKTVRRGKRRSVSGATYILVELAELSSPVADALALERIGILVRPAHGVVALATVEAILVVAAVHFGRGTELSSPASGAFAVIPAEARHASRQTFTAVGAPVAAGTGCCRCLKKMTCKKKKK